MTQPAAQTRITWGDLLLGPKKAAVWTICLGVALHAFNWFVINTITPSAVLELGGEELLSWVTAFYLVFSIVGSSGAAFLKGRLGLRTVLLGSSLLAIAGSLVIAAAPTMEVLLAGRIVQGFAEGMVMALCYVIAAGISPSAATHCSTASSTVGVRNSVSGVPGDLQPLL